MEFVQDKEDIFDNVEFFLENLEMGTPEEQQKSVQLIKKSKTFLVIDIDEVLVFVPSSFAGYKDNSIQNFTGKLRSLSFQMFSIQFYKTKISNFIL